MRKLVAALKVQYRHIAYAVPDLWRKGQKAGNGGASNYKGHCQKLKLKWGGARAGHWRPPAPSYSFTHAILCIIGY